MSEPRVWTLKLDSAGFMIALGAESLDPVQVIELEPILDLLERASSAIPLHDTLVGDHDALIDEINALCGRLREQP